MRKSLTPVGFALLFLVLCACGDDDGGGDTGSGNGSAGSGVSADGSGSSGDGDRPAGDGDSSTSMGGGGDGDGDGDGNPSASPGDGDGDGDGQSAGDGDTPGDGDGDGTGGGDGDGDGDGTSPGPITGNTDALVTEPLNVLWYGASTTSFGSNMWPNYHIPYLVSVFYEQVAGFPLPGTIQGTTRGSTPLALFWCRNSCSLNCANEMHQLHGGAPQYEDGCTGGMHGGSTSFGEGMGDGVWDYVVASSMMFVMRDPSGNPAESPPHASEAIYRTLKEVRDYRQANGSATRFINFIVARDDQPLSNSSQPFGLAQDLFMRAECVKAQAASDGEDMDTLPTALALYNVYRAIDTAHSSARLAQRSFRPGEGVELEGVTVPTSVPLYNFDSSSNPNTNVHFSRHGALVVALTAAYYLYGVDPLLTSQPTNYRDNNSMCAGGAELCDVSAEQFTFIQHVVKHTVDSYLEGDDWLECDPSKRIPDDMFIDTTPGIDGYGSDFGLDNTYSDPTGDGFCMAGEDCSGVLFPLPAGFPM